MRDTFVVGGLAVLAVAVGAGVFWYGQGVSSVPDSGIEEQPAAAIVPFEKLLSGTLSAVTERKNYLVTSPTQLAELWKVLKQDGIPPTIDFEKQAVIAVFAGEKPTSGYSISVAKVEDDDTRMVWVSVTEPEGDCILAQSITAPYEVIMLPATELALSHEDVPEKVSCGN